MKWIHVLCAVLVQQHSTRERQAANVYVCNETATILFSIVVERNNQRSKIQQKKKEKKQKMPNEHEAKEPTHTQWQRVSFALFKTWKKKKQKLKMTGYDVRNEICPYSMRQFLCFIFLV